MQAIWDGNVIAEADKDDLVYIEQNWYFPPDSVRMEYLRKSDTPYTCPWKGKCQYYNVGKADSDGPEVSMSEDAAFSYPEPLQTAIDRVHKDFGGYIAFWRDVQVSE